jgi:uncharacterized iron-regulated membrane protein
MGSSAAGAAETHRIRGVAPVAERQHRAEHPVATGLVALVGVGVAVGLVLALVVLVGTKFLGVGGGSSTADASARASLYLPRPARTTGPSGPLITLDQQAQQSPSASASRPPRKKARPAPAISLSAGETAVAPMQQIDLTGVYPRGEGAVLRVERFTSGSWEDFAQISVLVSNQTFSTYVQTSQPGINRFRVVDTDTGTTSNVVRVRIG